MPPDYSGRNLRGHSFKGQNLAGANFSYADIRGTNFTGANLRGANFTGAKAGLQKRWALSSFLIILVLTFSILMESINVTILVVILIVIYTISVASRYVAPRSKDTKKNAVFFTVVSTLTIAGLIALVLTLFISISLTKNISISTVMTGLLPIGVGLLGLICIVVVGSELGIISTARNRVEAGFIPLLLAVADEFLKTTITNTGATSFHLADLTEANFQQATLKNTNFGRANVTRTVWFQVKKLGRARVGKTYFQNPKVRELLTTGNGQDKKFDKLDLRGINLKGALLTDASFIGTDLSEACLQDADLSRAILKQTQLDNTDFTGAIITGAYIEDWNITHETNFRNVRCEYVYMRFPTKENPNPLRKPDNNAEIFTDGDFADFIQPIFDTLDLYHNQGVDPRAIAISFKKLAEKNPDAKLEIVAMEKRGDDKFLLRAKTAPEADKSELSAEYFDTYNQIKGLAESQIQLLLAEKDNQIHRLENMVMTALERPSFYSNTQIEQVRTMTNNPSGDSQNISFGNVDGSNLQVARDNSNQQMEANVTQPNEKQLTQADVIQMLAQIEELVNSTPELPEADKEKSLRYLGAAKEETQAPEADKQLAAGNLKRMAQTIETTSKTVESGKTLWGNVKPILKELPAYFGVAATFFGL
ncbi:MAG: pentapeptide repeat-containing protein [Cyanobacteriota bacterium]|nr:pentapeptide repeat-containing protein [Cyanobacteriota bacterium]